MQKYYYQINKIGLFVVNQEGTPELAIPDYLKTQQIIVKDLCGDVLFESAVPAEPWDCNSVLKAIAHVDTSYGADLYFGTEYIGSTEL